MASEISEDQATGEIAEIFAELRVLCGVPYVSAIHRYLAAKPGFLEWAWAAVGRAYRDGSIQEAGWQAAAGLSLPPLDPIPAAALSAWGLDRAALTTVRDAAEGFIRVAPVNMVFARLVKALLDGQAPGGKTICQPWEPPALLPPPPAMVDLAKLDPTSRNAVMLFASQMGGKPFVPGLYRMLGHWPGLVAHLGTVIRPRIASAVGTAAFDELRARVDAAVPAILASLPPVPTSHPRPSPADRADFMEVGQTYRKTSPELVVVGLLIREALPAQMG